MCTSSIIYLTWLVPALAAAGGYSSCVPNQCSFVGTSPAIQYANLAPCLTGPADYAAGSCSCADLDGNGHVSLRDFAAFQVAPVNVCLHYMEVRQEPGLGFCPELGSIYRANVLNALDGSKVLVGSLIAEGDPETDQCLPDVLWPPYCLIAKPFAVRPLANSEASWLATLVDRIPPSGCQPNCTEPCVGECCYVGDPCVIWSIREYYTWYGDYCYGEGNADEYRWAVQAVAAYLAELAGM